MSKLITLDRETFTRHTNNKHGTKCRKCDKQLTLGELVVSKYYYRRTKSATALYCLSCAKELNLV